MLESDLYNNSYILINSKKSNIYNIFISIFIVALLLFILISLLYKYDNKVRMKAFVQNNEINLMLDENNYKNITKKDILINNDIYKVDNIIIKEITYDNNYNVYYNVIAQMDLDNEYLIENNILDIDIVLGKTTLYKEILKRIRGE